MRICTLSAYVGSTRISDIFVVVVGWYDTTTTPFHRTSQSAAISTNPNQSAAFLLFPVMDQFPAAPKTLAGLSEYGQQTIVVSPLTPYNTLQYTTHGLKSKCVEQEESDRNTTRGTTIIISYPRTTHCALPSQKLGTAAAAFSSDQPPQDCRDSPPEEQRKKSTTPSILDGKNMAGTLRMVPLCDILRSDC